MGRQVLVVDDDLTTTTVLKGILEKTGYLVSVACSYDDALRMIDEGDIIFEIMIIDWYMPDKSGIELTKEIRQKNLNISPHIIFLTSNSDAHAELEAIESGADDYIQKPFFPEKLRARMIVATRQIQYQKKIMEMANYDPLTGLLNRRAGYVEGYKQLSRMHRYESVKEEVVILCDIDHFKAINDKYGHAQGDFVLQFVAKTLTQSLRPYETVVRYGGEEFFIILEVEAENLSSLLKRLAKKLSKQVQLPTSELISVTMSFGCLLIGQSEIEEKIEILLNHADELLYQAKGAGRNRAVVGKLNDDKKLKIESEIVFT